MSFLYKQFEGVLGLFCFILSVSWHIKSLSKLRIGEVLRKGRIKVEPHGRCQLWLQLQNICAASKAVSTVHLEE